MAEPFIAEIKMFGGNFAPRGWAFCDGQLLAISSNTALFSLLGTTYGGDGRTTFGLPDLRGRVSVHPGNGPGLSPYRLGEKGGAEDVVLNQTQMPNHTHFASVEGGGTTVPIGNKPITATATVHVDTTSATSDPTNAFLSQDPGTNIYGNRPDAVMNAGAVTVEGTVDVGNIVVPSPTITNTSAGGSSPHLNIQPFLAVNYIIALFGIFPSRS